MSIPPTTTTKRVPPPCWTQEETLALINAYGARWLSLSRGNLRTSDWDAVSSAVCGSSPGASKSSLQCRHKIEKLRKRYRSEKQRSLSFPGRFVSSWDLFPLLDSMNFGSSSAALCSNQSRELFNQKIVDVNGFRLKVGNDKNWMSKYGKIEGDLKQDFGLNHTLGSAFLKNYGNIDYDDDFENIDCDFKTDLGFDRDFGVGFGVKKQDGKYFAAPEGFRLKSYRNSDDDKSTRSLDFNHDLDGFPLRTFGDRIFMSPPGFRVNNFVKTDGNFNPNAYADHNAAYEVASGSGGEFYAKALVDEDFVLLGTRFKNYDGVGGNLNGNVDRGDMNGYGSSSRLRFGRKNGDGRIKRDLDPFEDLASSITLLTEKFLKMENMKMEMVRETQKMRMEMEMKHNQMILESQQHILDAVISGVFEKKRKKKLKLEMVSPKTTGKRDEV